MTRIRLFVGMNPFVFAQNRFGPETLGAEPAEMVLDAVSVDLLGVQGQCT